MPKASPYTTSFHRRILPWIYVIAFFAIAPAVVFYTAGYRWNTKKGKVERFSTVIIDSVPTGAKISIDGSPTTYVTPATIQTMTPGTHRFSLQLPGTYPWEKSLNMESERVTFANTIHLWKQSTPEERFSGTISNISASPDGRAVIRFIAATTTRVVVSDPPGANEVPFDLPRRLPQPLTVTWSNDSRYALATAATSTWLVSTRSDQKPLELAKGTYRWSGNVVTGTDGTRSISVTLPQSSITLTTLPKGTIDMSNGEAIRMTTGTRESVLFSTQDPERGLILPPGNWTFWSVVGTTHILRDGGSWLTLDPSGPSPTYHSANGTMLLDIPSGGPTRLLVNGGEIWTWDIGSDPELVYRQSERIVNAAWHKDANDVFFATATDVFALNLDPRDGRILTKLASFDKITDMTIAGKELLIAGTKDKKTGAWSLAVE